MSDTLGSGLKEIVSGSVLVFLATMVLKGSGFASRVLVAREFGAADYGVISIGLMLMSVGTIVSLLGLHSAAKRYVPRYTEKRSPEKVGGLVFFSLASSISVAGALIVGYAAFGDRILALFDEPGLDGVVWWFILAIPFAVVIRYVQQAALGFGNYRLNFVSKVLDKNGLVNLGLVLLVVVAGGGLVELGQAYALALVVGAVVAAAFLFRTLDSGLTLRGLNFEARTWLSFSLPLFASSSIGLILTWSDTFMLGVLLDSAAVGLYNAAYPIGTLLGVLLPALGSVFVPVGSRYFDQGDPEMLRYTFESVRRLLFLLVLPAYVFLVAFAESSIAVLFTAEYTAAAPVLVIVATGYFLLSFVGATTELLQILERTDRLLLYNTVSATLNVVLNLVLIPPFGIAGAAAAFSVSLGIVNLGLFWEGRKAVGIKLNLRSYVRPAVIGVIAIVVVRFTAGQATGGTMPGLVTIVVSGLCFGVVYLGGLLVGGALGEREAFIIDLLEERTGVDLGLVRRFL